MKKTRRWLALLLAVILVGSNALYQIGTSMSASETETTAESGQQDDSAAVPETQDQDKASLDQQKDTGGVQVQEVTPQTQQEKTNSQSEAAKTQQVQPAQNNTSASDQNTQAQVQSLHRRHRRRRTIMSRSRNPMLTVEPSKHGDLMAIRQM